MPISAKEKVSMFCQVDKEQVKHVEKKYQSVKHAILLFQVVCVSDVKTLYRVPLLLEDNQIFQFLSKRLHLAPKANYDRSLMVRWRDLTER